MVLTPAECLRLFSILDPLALFANERLDVMPERELRSNGPRGMNERSQGEVFRELWENMNVFDDFIAENPAELSPAQLSQAAEFRTGGINAIFTVSHVSDGRLLFCGCDRLFEVSGISREIERSLRTEPAIVETMLIPFEGRIVYMEALIEMQLGLSESMRQMFADDAERLLSEGRVISTAAQLLAEVPKIRAEALERETEALFEQLEDERAVAAESGEGWHRGVLAGLSFEEREVAIRAYDDERGFGRNISPAVMLAEHHTPGEPRTSLPELLADEDEDVLVELLDDMDDLGASIARLGGVEELVSAVEAGEMSAAEAIELLRERNATQADAEDGDTRPVIERAVRLFSDPEAVLSMIDGLGGHQLANLQRVVEAGGRLDIADDALTTWKEVPRPLLGLLYVFRIDGGYAFVVPDEVQTALREVDFAALRDGAQANDELIFFLNQLTELRGIVPLIDAATDWMLHEDPLTQIPDDEIARRVRGRELAAHSRRRV